MDLLAAEMTATTGKDPGQHFHEIAGQFGTPYYSRADAPATPAQKAVLKKLSPEAVKETTLAGEPILAKLTKAPGNNASIGGLKVVAANGWFAARPSGTDSLTTTSAASGTDPAMLVQTTMIPASRISRTAFVMSPPMSAPASTRARARWSRATARTACASWSSPTRGIVSTEIRSPRILCRSASETAPWATMPTWAPPPMTMTRLP